MLSYHEKATSVKGWLLFHYARNILLASRIKTCDMTILQLS